MAIHAVSGIWLVLVVGMLTLLWFNIRLTRRVKHSETQQQDWIALQGRQIELMQQASHDIRGPLAAVMGYVDLLVEDRVKKPEDKQKCLVNAKSSLVKIQSLLDVKLDQPVKDFMQQQATEKRR